ncbi:MAG TPA: hypothetical protein PLI12_08385 [Acetobacteraceae bacterium]|nr:hypothetical protein [Acetobacteraceae bacterium]
MDVPAEQYQPCVGWPVLAESPQYLDMAMAAADQNQVLRHRLPFALAEFVLD